MDDLRLVTHTDKVGHASPGSSQVTIDDILGMTGIPASKIADATVIEDACRQLHYRTPTSTEVQDIRRQVVGALAHPKLARAGSDRLAQWEHGWQEILNRVRANGYQPELLTPQYFQHRVLRFRGRYIVADVVDFEFRLYEILRRVLFSNYLKGCERLVEFGCGTGINLLLLSELFPNMSLIGCDWAQPSQELIKIIGGAIGHNLTGIRFDMFAPPDNGLIINTDTAVITMHALEQLGDKFRPFIDYIRAARPGICLHVEPVAELYDVSDPFDKVALDYHMKRNYLSGFLTNLHDLETNGEIDLIEVRRIGFGSLHHEAYSLVVWRPR